MNRQLITLGGGCFWCLEAVYELVDGVTAVESGYANGHLEHPSYEQVCSGTTGHAEVVRVSFDADRISLPEVLEIFFNIHDSTTLNQQGNDIGPQYRSGIYLHDAAQEPVVREVVAQANAALRGRVVTEVLPLANYWRAEDEHQHYYTNHPNQGYCAFVVAPKVDKFRRTFKARVKR
ncbi:MAG: peptide-methionine (S)-S-oxide reductase MsrA [Rubrivivax sp.]|nr:peptide-methionine (S)-S-oxide reductase MsrA [Rubrivivax sp.]